MSARAAAPQAIVGFPSVPDSLVLNMQSGPDAALWLTWHTYPDHFGLARMTTTGVLTSYPAPPSWTQPDMGGLTVGGGSTWVRESHGGVSYIGKWTVRGVLQQECPIPGAGNYGIAWGPDGALWFAGALTITGGGGTGTFIGRMTTAGVVTTYAMPNPQHLADAIISGPDGALWFSETNGQYFGRTATSGVIAEYQIPQVGAPSGPQLLQNIVPGPDGAIWVASPATGIVRAALDGTTHTYSVPTVGSASSPYGITVGADGNLWFLASTTAPGYVGRMSTSGTVNDVYPIPPGVANGLGAVITAGPDSKLWFGQQGLIGRLDPSIPPAPPTPSTPPTGSAPGVMGYLLITAGLASLVAAARWRRVSHRAPAPER